MALRQNKYRYELVTWYEKNADALLAVLDHFTPDAAHSQELMGTILDRLMDVWPAVDAHVKRMRKRGEETSADPHHVAAAWVTYDTLTRRYVAPANPPLPPQPAEKGSWTPLYESDRFLASSLLWRAEAIPSRVDWPLLHVLAKLEISDTDWARQTQAPLVEEAARLRHMRINAFELLTVVQLEAEDFPCDLRPRLPWPQNARPIEMVMGEHRMACSACGERAHEYVSPPHLIVGSIRHEVTLAALRQLWLRVAERHQNQVRRR